MSLSVLMRCSRMTDSNAYCLLGSWNHLGQITCLGCQLRKMSVCKLLWQIQSHSPTPLTHGICGYWMLTNNHYCILVKTERCSCCYPVKYSRQSFIFRIWREVVSCFVFFCELLFFINIFSFFIMQALSKAHRGPGWLRQAQTCTPQRFLQSMCTVTTVSGIRLQTAAALLTEMRHWQKCWLAGCYGSIHEITEIMVSSQVANTYYHFHFVWSK